MRNRTKRVTVIYGRRQGSVDLCRNSNGITFGAKEVRVNLALLHVPFLRTFIIKGKARPDGAVSKVER